MQKGPRAYPGSGKRDNEGMDRCLLMEIWNWYHMDCGESDSSSGGSGKKSCSAE